MIFDFTIEKTERPLLLVDGPNLAYRAFHAVPQHFSNSKGEASGALFGFMNSLMPLLEKHAPKELVVAWDAPGGSKYRKDLHPEYKAGRSAMPDGLKEQWPHFLPFVEAFGGKNIMYEEVEADDIIGSIATQASGKILILSGDRDLYQLVTDDVRILAPQNGSGTKEIGIEEVKAKYGVNPEQVVDFIALRSDKSDNIPGVPGMGPKKIAQLLSEWNTLDNAYTNLEEIKPQRVQSLLKDHEAAARLGQKLAQIILDLPVPTEFEKWAPNVAELKRITGHFEFKAPAGRLEGLAHLSQMNK